MKGIGIDFARIDRKSMALLRPVEGQGHEGLPDQQKSLFLLLAETEGWEQEGSSGCQFNRKGYPYVRERTSRERNMVAYELYWHDDKDEPHFIGILPERRKKTERITKESVVNWGVKVIGDSTAFKDIFFTRVEV